MPSFLMDFDETLAIFNLIYLGLMCFFFRLFDQVFSTQQSMVRYYNSVLILFSALHPMSRHWALEEELNTAFCLIVAGRKWKIIFNYTRNGYCTYNHHSYSRTLLMVNSQYKRLFSIFFL